VNLITDPAFWSALGVLLAAVGVEAPRALTTHIAEAIAAISGIVGIIMAWRDDRGE